MCHTIHGSKCDVSIVHLRECFHFLHFITSRPIFVLLFCFVVAWLAVGYDIQHLTSLHSLVEYCAKSTDYNSFEAKYIRITYLTYSLNRPQKLKVDSVELSFWYGLDLRLLLIRFHRYIYLIYSNR